MISNRGGFKELSIFDNFQIDRKLPKYKKVSDIDENQKVAFDSDDFGGPTDGDPRAWITVSDTMLNTRISGSSGMSYSVPSRYSFKSRFKNWLIEKLEGPKPKVAGPKTKLISVIEFFTSLSKSYEELTPIAEIADHYEKALLQAKTMGQVSLVQKLQDILDITRSEAHLISMKLSKYVTEKQVVDFYEKVGEDKNLKLTWIKNFGRIIPEDVYTAKKLADERNIFDNYVILHYDPENNGETLTKEEIEKKKDPILFGLIKNSRKLYYVADWKDEYCELTLEEMFKTLKGKVLQINNKSVKTFIDKTTL